MSTTEDRYAEAGILPAAQSSSPADRTELRSIEPIDWSVEHIAPTEPGADPAEPPAEFAEVEVDPASTRVTHKEDGMPVLHDVEDGELADDDTSDTDQEA